MANLPEDVARVLRAGYFALRSYEYGNQATDLAKDTAQEMKDVIDAHGVDMQGFKASRVKDPAVLDIGSLVHAEFIVKADDGVRKISPMSIADAVRHTMLTLDKHGFLNIEAIKKAKERAGT